MIWTGGFSRYQNSDWYCWLLGAKSCWFSAPIFLTLVLVREKAEAHPMMGLVGSGVEWRALVPVTGLNGNVTQHWLTSAYSRRWGLQAEDWRLNYYNKYKSYLSQFLSLVYELPINFLKCENDEPSNLLQSCLSHLLDWCSKQCKR